MKMDPTSSHESVGHETRDVKIRPVVLALLGGVAVALVFIGLMWLLLDFSSERQALQSPPANPLAATFARKEPPEPRLQTHPLRDLAGLRQHENELLHNYGWADKNAGVARIPIDRAKELIVKRGVAPLPALPGGQP